CISPKVQNKWSCRMPSLSIRAKAQRGVNCIRAIMGMVALVAVTATLLDCRPQARKEAFGHSVAAEVVPAGGPQPPRDVNGHPTSPIRDENCISGRYRCGWELKYPLVGGQTANRVDSD